MKCIWPLLLALLLAACAGQPDLEEGIAPEPLTPEEQFQQAEADRAKGNYGEALSNYAPLTERDDEWAQMAKLAIARMTLDQGQNREALRAYELILEEQVDNVEAQEGRGLALLALGDWQGAQKQLALVNQAEPKRWRVLNGLGVAADMQGDYRAAARWYGEALQSGGERPMVINNAGYSLIMSGEYEEAEKLLTRGSLRYPKEARLSHNLGIAQARQGNYNTAIRTWQKTMDRPSALNNAGYVAKLNGDLEKSQAFFREAIEISTRYRPKINANLESVQPRSAD